MMIAEYVLVLWTVLFIVLFIMDLRLRDIGEKLETMHFDLETINKNIVTIYKLINRKEGDE